jgi:hypothetical protein
MAGMAKAALLPLVLVGSNTLPPFGSKKTGKLVPKSLPPISERFLDR